jgi:hypothetical protein
MTPWNGQRAFRGDRLIQVQFRNGLWSKQSLSAHKWNGVWREPIPHPYEYDIVAVREVA